MIFPKACFDQIHDFIEFRVWPPIYIIHTFTLYPGALIILSLDIAVEWRLVLIMAFAAILCYVLYEWIIRSEVSKAFFWVENKLKCCYDASEDYDVGLVFKKDDFLQSTEEALESGPPKAAHTNSIEGSISPNEIKVEASGWFDFVFEKDHDLRTLE